VLELLLDVSNRGRRVSKSKGREDYDVNDPLEVKNEQENGRTTMLVILWRLKIIRRMGGSRY